MMKYLLIFLLSSLSVTLAGQQMFPLRTSTDSIRFSVTSENGKLSLQLNRPLKPGEGAFPSVTGLRLDDGGLLIDYQYKGRLKKGLDYDMQVALLPLSGFPILPTPGEVTDNKAKNNTGVLNWPDRTERGLDYGQSYTLVVLKSLMGEVDCEAGRPAFGIQKQWPYYATAIVGGGLIGLGQVYRQDKKEAYARYQEAWKEGQTAESAESDFKDANSKDDTARLLTYIGCGLLAVDALGFAWRWGANKRRQGLFDQYCTPEGAALTVAPCIFPSGGPEGALAGTGLRLHFQF
ncbi:MAG: hypothetical protein H6573_30115 [Lewinellaceae bacterium]|nr:hypothetical protein [Phaeodactylibacter sp.]MCB9351715.1 hypothetical protein [Lewinellaceae bacterium]